MPRRPVAIALGSALLVAFACTGVRRAVRTPTLTRGPVSPLGHYAAGMSLRQTFETFPPTDGTARLTLLVSNLDAWAERWRLMAETERSLDVSYFILHQDVFGVAFLGHLLAKAEAGVRIRVLLDAFGTKMSRSLRGGDYLDELADNAHASVRMYRPPLTRYVEAFLRLDPTVAFASEHDKIIVSDGRRSVIGGRNIGSEYFTDRETRPDVFHDTDLRIDGEAMAAGLTRAFEAQYTSKDAVPEAGDLVNVVSRRSELLDAYRAMDAWLRAPLPDPPSVDAAPAGGVPLANAPPAAGGGANVPRPPGRDQAPAAKGDWQRDLEKLPKLRGALRRPRPRAFAAETRILDSTVRLGGDTRDDPITTALIRLVESARETIRIQSPYLVLSEEGVEVLARAGRRGVEITVLTNSPVSSDNALSQAFFLEQWPEILARVPHMRLFVGGREGTLHDKVAVFDDVVSTVGTYNLDPTSMALNSEVVAATWSAELARAVAAEQRRMIAAGPPVAYEYRIARDPEGNALRDDEGDVRVVFGPRDHCTPEQWSALAVYWTALKLVEGLTGFSPLF